jgi:hypothetical protein
VNETLKAALMSAAVSGLIGLMTFVAALWRLRHEQRRERERADETLTSDLVKERVDPYIAFMRSLESMSNTRLAHLSEEERRREAASFGDVFHRAIYGEVGLLATHETREVIVCARARCRGYAEGRCSYEDMLDAVWAIHQMLRSDLNLRQPRLTHAIERLRQDEMPEDKRAIEDLIRSMVHIRYEPVAGRASNAGTR